MGEGPLAQASARRVPPVAIAPHPPLAVEIFCDLACPWCFIGKRRLESAIALERPGGIRLRWRAFELRPELPAEGVEARGYFLRKFGGEERMRQAFDRVRRAGRDDGIRFAFSRIRRACSTRLAHRLVAIAGLWGVQSPALEALFAGHFEQGADIGRLDECLRLFGRHGLDPDAFRRAHEHGAGRSEVESDLVAAARLGVDSVPFFVASGYAVVGAQPVETYRSLLEAARKAEAPA